MGSMNAAYAISIVGPGKSHQRSQGHVELKKRQVWTSTPISTNKRRRLVTHYDGRYKRASLTARESRIQRKISTLQKENVFAVTATVVSALHN